jgi:CRISPR/Cas system-associated exonuclease Cas4 (RecB family)
MEDSMSIPVEVSPIRAFQKCNRAFWYRYVRDLKAKRRSAPMFLGIEIHKFFQDTHELGDEKSLARIDERWGALSPEERTFYQNRGKNENNPPLPDDVRRLVRGYRANYPSDEWNTLEVEKHMKGEIDGLAFVGIADVIAEIPLLGEGLTVVDHKSTTRIPDEVVQLNDPQLAIYAVMAKRLYGLDIRRVMWNYIVTKPPTIPEIVGLKDKTRQDGTFSPKKGPRLSTRQIATDAYTYRETLLVAARKHPEIDPNDGKYVKVIRTLNSQPNPFFRRVVIELTPEIEAQAIKELSAVHSVMNAMIAADVFPRTVSMFTCPTCEFKRLCSAELMNHKGDIAAAMEDMQTDNYSRRHEDV